MLLEDADAEDEGLPHFFKYILQKFYNVATLDWDGSTICLCTYTHAVKSTKGSFARRIANKAL